MKRVVAGLTLVLAAASSSLAFAQTSPPVASATPQPAVATATPAAVSSPAASPAAVPAQSAAPAAVSPSPLPENRSVTARAKTWYDRLRKNDIDRSQLTGDMSAAMTADQVSAVSQQIAPLGEPVSFTYVLTLKIDPFIRYQYELAFKDGSKLRYLFVLDKSGKIAGLFLQPVG